MFRCGRLAAHWYTQILKDHQNLPSDLIHLCVCPSHHASFLTLHKNAKEYQKSELMENTYFYTSSLSTAQCIQAAQKYSKSRCVTGPIFNKLMLSSISNIL